METPLRHFLLFFVTALSLSFATLTSVGAQTPLQNMMDKGNESSISVDKDSIDNLIDTLESDKQREDFLENLKALVEADEQIEQSNESDSSNNANSGQEGEEEDNSEEVSAPSFDEVTGTLGLNDQTQELIEGYHNFLDENNLNNSSVGKTALALIALIIILVVAFAVRKASIVGREKAIAVKNKYHLTHDRIRMYLRVIRYVCYFILVCLYGYTLGAIWETNVTEMLVSDGFTNFFSEILNVLFVVMLGIIVWELINGFIEYTMFQASGPKANRINTLLPIMRNVLVLVFGVLLMLVLLSELGIDIMPLLAGAGVLGIAIGFGAQTMVKDYLTGFMIIFEDLIRVGDVATLADRTGIIEKITIRKVQLRDLNGTVYTVPFGEVSVVENLTKDFSYYLMDIGIAYREDSDEVVTYLQEIDEELRNDDDYKDHILEPIEILGVDHFADSAVVIKARIKTRPMKQWSVGREYNRRMKHKFDKHDIEIPFPHQTIYFGKDKQGNAPSAPIEILRDEAKNNADKSLDNKSSEAKNKKNNKKPKKESKTGYDKDRERTSDEDSIGRSQ